MRFAAHGPTLRAAKRVGNLVKVVALLYHIALLCAVCDRRSIVDLAGGDVDNVPRMDQPSHDVRVDVQQGLDGEVAGSGNLRKRGIWRNCDGAVALQLVRDDRTTEGVSQGI